MTFLAQPDDLTSLVLRTDFSDDTAWDVLKAAIDGRNTARSATYASNRAYDGVTIQALVDMDAAAIEDDKLT